MESSNIQQMSANCINGKSKRKEKLSIEMILRKSFMNSLKEYGRNCSLAGAKQMCDPNICLFKRLIWVALFCISLGTVCYYLQYIWSDMLTKPFIVSLESAEYPIKSMDFPAVAICNINRISKKALAKLAKAEYTELSKKESLEEVQRMLANLGRLIDFSYNESLQTHPVFMRMVRKYRLDNDKMADVMGLLAPNCDDILRRCAWNGKETDCKELFVTRRIANRGHCCTFNYVLNFHTFAQIDEEKIEARRQEVPGYIHGLNVVLDPMLDDYAYPLRRMQGFDIFIFDPMQFADPSAGRVVHRITDPNTAVFLELMTTKQIATPEVRKYSLDTRKCLFHNEPVGEYPNMFTYSYSTCIILCKLETIESLCKCTPFYYATHKNYRTTPVCTLENLKCLNKYREKLFYLYPYDAEDLTGLEIELQDSLDCEFCWPDCELSQHTAKSYVIPLKMAYMQKSMTDILYQPLDNSTISFLSVYYPTNDGTLVKLDACIYWFEVLSNLGGFCGICVGFSLTSLAEIVYYFTIRYMQHCYINFKKYH